MTTPAYADMTDDIFDLEATQARPAAPSPSMPQTGQGGVMHEPTNTIKVNVEGVPAPIEFPEGTDPAVIQETVKRISAQQNPSAPNFPHAPELAGAAGAAGVGFYGATVGGPPGAAVGAVAGGAGGHFIGQTIQDLSNGIDQSFDRIADNALAATKAGLLGGAFEGVASFLKPGVEALAEPFRKAGRWVGNKLFVPVQQSEVIKKSDDLLKSIGAPGLTAGQLSDPGSKRLATVAENMAYNSMTTSVVNNVRTSQQQGLKDYVAGLMEQWGKLPTKDAVDLFKWAVDDNFNTLYKKPMDVAMQDIRDNFMGTINATPLLRRLQNSNEKVASFIKTMFQKEHDSDPAAYDKLISLLQPAKGSKTTAALPNLSFDEAMILKTSLRELGEKNFTDAAGKQMAIQAKSMSKTIDAAIRRDLSGTPDLLRSYDQSMATYAEGMHTFRNDLAQKFMQKIAAEPGAMATALLKPGQLEFVENVKTMVGDQMWKQVVEPRLAATILYKSFGIPNAHGVLSIEGALSGKKLATELQQLAVDGTAQSVLGKPTYTKLLDLAQVIDHVGKPPKGAGGVFIQLAQAGAAGAVIGGAAGLLTGNDAKSAGIGATVGAPVFILLGPRMLGNLVARPDYIEAFKTGLKQTAATGRPSSVMIQVIRQLGAQETARSFSAEPTPPPADTQMPRANVFARPKPQAAFTPEGPAQTTPPAMSRTGR